MTREIRQRWQLLQEHGDDEVDLRIRLLGSFTMDRLIPYVGVAFADCGRHVAVDAGPYNQVVQECLDPDSETRRLGADVVVIWTRLEQLWRGMPAPLDGPADRYAAPLEEVAEAAIQAAEALGARLVFVLPALPDIRPLGIGDHANPTGVIATATAAREAVRRYLAGRPGALVVDAEDVVRRLGSDKAVDHRLEYLADIPYRDEVFELVADHIVRSVGLTTRPAPKVVAVDADGTLWAGEAADPAHIELDGPAAAASLELQRLLSDLRRAGMLLALCSKNVEEDVRAALALPGMHLSWEDFSASSVGWDSKVEALQTIASELNLALDDFVFIDDSPAEIMEVTTKLPEVRTVLLPRDPTTWPVLRDLRLVLDRLPPTTDDLQRVERYAAERQRQQAAHAAVSDDDYRSRLAPQVRVFEPAASHLPRFAQLLQRTNQFRLNLAKYDEAQLAQVAHDDRTSLRLAEAWDAFGEYGIVAGAVLQRDDRVARLVAFAVSCRALGRGIEDAFLADVVAAARDQWGCEVVATVEETGRNEPAVRFFRTKGVEPGHPSSLISNVMWPDYVARRPSR